MFICILINYMINEINVFMMIISGLVAAILFIVVINLCYNSLNESYVVRLGVREHEKVEKRKLCLDQVSVLKYIKFPPKSFWNSMTWESRKRTIHS